MNVSFLLSLFLHFYLFILIYFCWMVEARQWPNWGPRSGGLGGNPMESHQTFNRFYNINRLGGLRIHSRFHPSIRHGVADALSWDAEGIGDIVPFNVHQLLALVFKFLLRLIREPCWITRINFPFFLSFFLSFFLFARYSVRIDLIKVPVIRSRWRECRLPGTQEVFRVSP